MTGISLKATVRIIKKKNKTQAKLFKDLKEGDELQFVYGLSGWYHSAPEVDIYLKGEYVHTVYPNQLNKNLSHFEWEQIA
ncbi:hypothetical protein [Rummeliibacillus stabekisii]|uniref:hypothetical protein n=1 Tax=Rummeliibacillus stabekisii TaxID=241244 RepID=UPI00371220E1